MWAFLAGPFGKIAQWTALAVAGAGAIAAALVTARNGGKSAQLNEDKDKALQNVKVQKDAEKDVANLSDADLDKRMQKWTRN